MCSRTQQAFEEEAHKFAFRSYFESIDPAVKGLSDPSNDDVEVIGWKFKRPLNALSPLSL